MALGNSEKAVKGDTSFSILAWSKSTAVSSACVVGAPFSIFLARSVYAFVYLEDRGLSAMRAH